jgi:hypothetical protein
MKYLPSTGQHWLSFLSFPFKAFVLASTFIYPIWLHSTRPLRSGTFSSSDYTVIDPDSLPVSFEVIVTCYFITFLALLVIVIIQVLSKNRKGAFWSSIFAFLALCLAVGGAAQPVYK